MYKLNQFTSRDDLDQNLAANVAKALIEAVAEKGRASIAVSGGSTPKGFFKVLSAMPLDWPKITITLADERWVDIADDASNTRLVHESLLQGQASKAKFFHLKQGDNLDVATLSELNNAAEKLLLPFDVLILGMGEDGHTASLFPCSDEIEQGLAESAEPLLKVVPKTAPHDRISFSLNSLAKSKQVILHICGQNKQAVLEQALENDNSKQMPIRAFLHAPEFTTEVYWAE